MTGEELRAARIRAGYSQTALAKLIGVSRQTIWYWEHGKYPISGPGAYILARLPAKAQRQAK